MSMAKFGIPVSGRSLITVLLLWLVPSICSRGWQLSMAGKSQAFPVKLQDADCATAS
jgi:hypothetical protein